MAKSKRKALNLKPPPDSRNNIDHDHDHDHDHDTNTGGDDSISASGIIANEYHSPCIFHIYFGKCTNDDCKFSHSIRSIASRPPSPRSSSPTSDWPQQTSKDSHRGSRPQGAYFQNGASRRGGYRNSSREIPPKSNGRTAGKGKSSNFSGANDSWRQERSKKNKKTVSAAIALTEQEMTPRVEETTTTAHIEEIPDEPSSNINEDRDVTDEPESTGLECTTIPSSKDSLSAEPPNGVDVRGEQDHEDNLPINDNVDNYSADVDERLQLDRESEGQDPALDEQEDVGRITPHSPVNNKPGEEEDKEDLWGWNGPPQRKKVGKEERELEEVNDDELEYASIKEDAVEAVDAKIDSAWYEAPEEEEEDSVEDQDDTSWDQTPEQEDKQSVCDNGDDQGKTLAPVPRSLPAPSEPQPSTQPLPTSRAPSQVQTPAAALPVEPPTAAPPLMQSPVAAPPSIQSPAAASPPSMQSPAAASPPMQSPAAAPPMHSPTTAPPFAQPPANVPPLSQPPTAYPQAQAPPTTNARQISLLSLHWSRFADPTIDPSLAFCKAFAQNKCSSTSFSSCKFRHCITPQEYTLLFKDPQPLPCSLEKHLIRNDSPENMTPITSPSITLHWSHFADPTCNPSVAFCKAYAEHMCPNDNACMFRHCLTVEEYTLLFKDPQPNLIAMSGSVVQHQQQAVAPPATGLNQQANAQPTNRPAPCVFFRKGTCRNGESCTYYHDRSSSCQNIQSRGYCDEAGCINCSSSQSQQPAPRPAKKACLYWPLGTCKNGDNCPFAHNGEFGAAATKDDGGENGTWETNAEGDQMDTWRANGDSNAWGDPGNWEDQGKDKDKQEGDGEGDTGGGGGDQNQGTGWRDGGEGGGWDDQGNKDNGWDKQDNSGWGNNNDSGWGNNNDNNTNAARSNNWRDRSSWNDNKRDTNRSSRGACWKFSQGRCSRGSDCRFSHDVQVGGSSGRASRDASRQDRIRANSSLADTPPAGDSATPASRVPRTSSTYGGRHLFDNGYIEQWGREVAASSAGSEAGGSRATGQVRTSNSGSGSGSGSGSSPRRESRGRGPGTNRSVDAPSIGNGSCQFHIVGRCSNGDTCPSSHDPAVAGTGIDAVADDEDRQGEIEEKRRPISQDVDGDGVGMVGDDTGKRGGEGGECIQSGAAEELTPNDDDDTHANEQRVVDSKWGLDDQWDDKPIEVPEEEIRINKPCLAYGQGHCPAGDYCHFLHIDPEEPSPESVREEEQPAPQQEAGQDASEVGTRDHISDIAPQNAADAQDYGHPLVERSIFGCAIIFGRDCLPEKVTTGTDSHVLLLDGPPGITEARVHDAVNKYGAIEDIVITQERPDPCDENAEDREQQGGDQDEEQEEPENVPPPRSVIRVQFKEMKDAVAAAKGMKATLADAIPIEPAPSTSTWVRFRWPQATRAAWVFYPTITKAKAMAEKLHNTTIQDRKISASFVRPDKRAKDLYAIKLERLPMGTTREDLKDMVEDAKLITMSELTYTDNVREILQQFGGVKSFVDIPEDPSKISAVAFARFDSEDSMLLALRMHGTKHKFLGKQELVVERVWFAHYTLPAGAFKVVSAEVAALHIQCEGRATVESSELGEHAMIYLYASPEETATFVKTNLSLHAICRGMIVMTANNRPEWDGYLFSTSSAKVIENLNSKSNFYIFPNTSTRRIHVLGSGLDQDKGVSTVKKLLQKVRGSCREYPIHRNAIRQLVNGGLSDIQGDVGANKLSLDVLRSVLVVKGGDETVTQKIRHALDFVPSNGANDRSGCLSSLCSICELQPDGGDSNSAVKLSCGHVYCMTCLQHALMSAAHHRSAPITCIGRVPVDEGEDTSTCGQAIAYTTIRDLLPLLDEPKYLEATFTTFVLCNPDEYFFCPSFRCDVVYRRGESGDTVRCPICRAWNCLFCGTMIHDGVNCREAQETRKTIQA